MEISIKDLRIGNVITLLGWDEDAGGNIISDPSGNETVIVDINVLKNIIKGDNLIQYKPIPLTEEWLLKFRLEYNSQYGIYEIKSNYNISLELYNGSFTLFFNDIDIIEIKHVHQLQNLYFALTNEELTIK